MSDTFHVVPIDDLIEHDSSGDHDGLRGPTTEPVEREDGSMGWLVSHHSLDGRELHEAAAAQTIDSGCSEG